MDILKRIQYVDKRTHTYLPIRQIIKTRKDIKPCQSL